MNYGSTTQATDFALPRCAERLLRGVLWFIPRADPNLEALNLTTLQKLRLILELAFVALEGPLVAIFYKGDWWLEMRPRKTSGT